MSLMEYLEYFLYIL